jgi:hypothetical protein
LLPFFGFQLFFRFNVPLDWQDGDVSIRRRALDLIYALVTKSNVKPLVKELLNYLALAQGDLDFKADLTDKICLVVEKYLPPFIFDFLDSD